MHVSVCVLGRDFDIIYSAVVDVEKFQIEPGVKCQETCVFACFMVSARAAVEYLKSIIFRGFNGIP